MSIGIYDFEKKAPQRVIINLELSVIPLEKGKDYHIGNVVSYEEIANKIKNLIKSRHYDLLEELAEDIARSCLKDKKIRHLQLTIEKPDIIKNTQSVGIQITREQCDKP